MPDSIQISSAMQSMTGMGVARKAQDVDQLVQAKLLASIEQAGQAQAAVRSPDQVQISPQAQQLLASECG
jgi:hypothetical protein